MATEALCLMLVVLCSQKEKKKKKNIVDLFLGVMKRTVWAVYHSKIT